MSSFEIARSLFRARRCLLISTILVVSLFILLYVPVLYNGSKHLSTISWSQNFKRYLVFKWGNDANNYTEKSPASKVLIIYWTKTHIYDVPVNVNPKVWPFFYVDKNCPVECELTTDKNRVGEASALVVHSRNMAEMPPKYLKNISWIIHSNDNPIYTPALRDHKIMSQFNYSATYRLDSDFPCPEFTKPLLDLPVPFADKKGLVMFAMTNCEWLRTEYVKRLMKIIKVDSYGKCLKNKEGLKARYTEHYEHAWRAVREIQRGYKFSLIFPNADCDYYMTEKIHNAMSAGSVPVWMGTNKIDEVLQWGNLKHSIIKVNNFASPVKLAEYLQYLARNETEYNKYLKWKYEGFQFPKEYYTSAIGQWWDGLPLYCRICMRIAKNPKGHKGLPVDKCDGDQQRTVKKWLKNN